ncbi:hypothetical protein ONZ43_g5546 [Nemania bipapillata]|uniref:Uncharacterized protein n=1 Tax=Nemania bipapillata TaxID=110536 RepID=A0ACC2I9D0_9PEZI|nr:hypothetical protein ONZ43_g5546 [Nemania bipapillata]
MLPPPIGFPPLILGLIGIILGIIEVSKKHYAMKRRGSSVVRITVGLDSEDGLVGAGGYLPDIQLFNEAGKFLGKHFHPGKVKTGEYVDIVIKHSHYSPQQPTYALLGANKNAICIATALITWPDGSQYAWMGDWGYKCGGTWYYSNIYVQPAGIKPRCLWIDENDAKIRTGFQVHWPEFAYSGDKPLPDTVEGKEMKANYLCTAGPPFTMHEQPNRHPNEIVFWAPGSNESRSDTGGRAVAYSYGVLREPTEDDYQANNQTTTELIMGMSLVVSDTEEHSAEELCDSSTSLGPDFFNARTGSFCRMSDKTVWPSCNGINTTDNCFDIALSQLVLGGITARSEAYSRVIDWTSGR